MNVRSSIDFEEKQGAMVVRPRFARLDAVAATGFRGAVLGRVAGKALVVMVMDEITFVDSTGIGCLVAVLKAIPAGAHVRLVGISEAVRTVLKLTRLDRVFRAFDNVDAALEA